MCSLAEAFAAHTQSMDVVEGSEHAIECQEPILEGYMGQYINFSTITLVSKKRRLRQVAHIHICVQTCRSFCCSHAQSRDVDEGSVQNLDM